MILEKMLELLPNSTDKPEMRKIISLAARTIEEAEQTLETISRWRDIDQSEGVALDRLGKDVGQARRGMADPGYRRNIKLRIRSNLSGGEIETLNSIFSLLMGDGFLGLDEGWNHDIEKPATLVLNVAKDAGELIDRKTLKIIKAGGVGIQQATTLKGQTLRLVGSSYTYDIQVPITAMYQTAEREGVGANADAVIGESSYTTNVYIPICGAFYAGGERAVD